MTTTKLSRARASCPCCHHPTLTEHGAFEICILCWWEDDGQGDRDADVVRGGPNGDVSLTVARANFQEHLTMYREGSDTPTGRRDTAREVQAKRVIIRAFARLSERVAASEAGDLRAEIDQACATLQAEADRKAQEFETSSSIL